MSRPTGQDACVFCSKVLGDADRVLAANAVALAVQDAYPSAPGHTLVIPRRHVARLADLGPGEAAGLWDLVHGQVRRLDPVTESLSIGVNDGPAAGQTVPHVHVHLIPRSSGDVEDPRGGIRLVLPGTARYWDQG